MKDQLGDAPFASLYPERPGWRRGSPPPSRLAAERIAGRAKSINTQILELPDLKTRGMTSDEIARALDMPNNYASRPRIAELKAQGRLVDTGERRAGESGLLISVWKLSPRLPDHPHLRDIDR
jgi:hypothetical protein